MSYYNHWCEPADRYYDAWRITQGALEHAVRENANLKRDLGISAQLNAELVKANAALQQSLDEATARINVGTTPNLINYPVRKLGKTKPKDLAPFQKGDLARGPGKFFQVSSVRKKDGSWMIQSRATGIWYHASDFHLGVYGGF